MERENNLENGQYDKTTRRRTFDLLTHGVALLTLTYLLHEQNRCIPHIILKPRAEKQGRIQDLPKGGGTMASAWSASL